MKKLLLSSLLILTFSISTFAQTTLKGAENFTISLPINWQRTIGANDLASVQWEHKDDELYGYMMFENLDEIKLIESEKDLSNLSDYADLSASDFSDLTKFKNLSARNFKTTSNITTEQREISYYNEEIDVEIFMLINIYKTENFIYKMINFGTEESYKNGKKDMEYIINNIQLP